MAPGTLVTGLSSWSYGSSASFSLLSTGLFPLTLGKDGSKRAKKGFPQVQHGESTSSFGLLIGAWIFIYLQEVGDSKVPALLKSSPQQWQLTKAVPWSLLCNCGVPHYWRVSSPTAMIYSLYSLRRGLCESYKPLESSHSLQKAMFQSIGNSHREETFNFHCQAMKQMSYTYYLTLHSPFKVSCFYAWWWRRRWIP